MEGWLRLLWMNEIYDLRKRGERERERKKEHDGGKW